MPLIIISGYPSSGKSTWATKLADYIRQEYKKETVIVREEELLRGDKNEILDGKWNVFIVLQARAQWNYVSITFLMCIK